MGWYHVNRIGKGICLGDVDKIHYNEDFIAKHKYHFSDGIHTLPCKVDKQTHEVFDISGKTQLVKELVEDDDFSFDSDEEATLFEVYDDLDYAEVEVDG